MKWLADIDLSPSGADDRGGGMGSGKILGQRRKYFNAVMSLLSRYQKYFLSRS